MKDPFQVQPDLAVSLFVACLLVNGVTKYKVRPHADPKRPNKTEFMTKSDIKAESLKESEK